MKTRFSASLALTFAMAAAAALAPRTALAQATPKTANIMQDVAPDGSVTITMDMSFDAAPWKQWKAQVGDDPSRLRAMMKHQFSAYVIDDFKFEKNDLDRTAKVTMRSPAGPELRKDGRFRVAVEKEFRLINNNGREWFFSGNNPYAGNSLQTVKVTLPPNATGVDLNSAGSSEQALIYGLNVPSGKAHLFTIFGAIIAALGALLLGAAFLLKKSSPPPPHPAAAAT